MSWGMIWRIREQMRRRIAIREQFMKLAER
jgi:hypothetical protein